MNKIHFLFGVLALMIGCGLKSGPHERRFAPNQFNRADRFRAPMSLREMKELWRAEVADFLFTFAPQPEFPTAGEPVRIELRVREKRFPMPAPVSGAQVRYAVHLPGQTGHVHCSEPYADTHEVSSGVYRASVSFPAASVWEVDFNVYTKDARCVGIDFPLNVEAVDIVAPSSARSGN